MAELLHEPSDHLQVDVLRVYAPPMPPEHRLWHRVFEQAEVDLQSSDPALRDDARRWLTSDTGAHALIRAIAPEPKAHSLLRLL